MTVITVREFVDLVLDDHCSSIKIYDNNESTDMFKGFVCDLTDDILDRDIGSWDIEDGTICLNID